MQALNPLSRIEVTMAAISVSPTCLRLFSVILTLLSTEAMQSALSSAGAFSLLMRPKKHGYRSAE
jgi:hypothetical protein